MRTQSFVLWSASATLWTVIALQGCNSFNGLDMVTYDTSGAGGETGELAGGGGAGGCSSGSCELDSSCIEGADSCGSGHYCAMEQCLPKKGNGDGCAGEVECLDGLCVDGVCCDSACEGACESCNLDVASRGTCTGIPAGTDPEEECFDESVCSASRECTKLSDGKTCQANEHCASGSCADGVCCDTSCNEPCKICNAHGWVGQCLTVASGFDPNDKCAGPAVCNAAGECRLPNGQACNSNNECLSNSCADGVCCDSSCIGPCSACSFAKKKQGPDGVCGYIKAGEDPDNECFPSNVAVGNCNGAGACK